MQTEDCEGYIEMLEKSKSENLLDIDRSGCVQVTHDKDKLPVVLFIPKLAFDTLKGQTEDEIVKKMMYFFIKTADQLVTGSYSIIYCHTAVNILSQRSLIRDYYKIMPRRYKKNLKQLYIIYPQVGIKLFFEFTRMFISSKFYSKLHYFEDIYHLQQTFPPGYVHSLHLPPHFLYWEDICIKNRIEHRNEDCNYQYSCLLKDVYIKELHAPYLVYRCVEYLRSITTSSGTGIMIYVCISSRYTLSSLRL